MEIADIAFYVIALFLQLFFSLFQWISELFRSMVFSILTCGAIPRHVAFIMDGNRRYAVQRGLPARTDGHLHGFHKLEEILQWSFELGIKEVTVYAFSIENFKRTKEEVDMLMKLAFDKLEEAVVQNELIKKNQVRIRVIGNLDLLPAAVRRSAYTAMHKTQHFSKHKINICFPYTSTAEIIAASNKMLESKLSATASRLTQLMWVGVPDVIIRTSGERRLSDFLTWQCTQRPAPMIAFVDALWPDFGLRHLLHILARYQMYHNARKGADFQEDNCTEWKLFLKKEQERDQKQLEINTWENPLSPPSSPSFK